MKGKRRGIDRERKKTERGGKIYTERETWRERRGERERDREREGEREMNLIPGKACQCPCRHHLPGNMGKEGFLSF